MNIFLTKNKILENLNNYSIECGAHDGKQHFDHHDKFASNISPANNKGLTPLDESKLNSSKIFISHIDCDTFLGINRLLANKYSLPMGIDFSIIERIDLNGDSILGNIKFISDTHAYYVGIGSLARKLNFPRVTSEDQDVTEFIIKMLETSKEEIIKLGKQIINQEEETWYNLDKMFYCDNKILLVPIPKGVNFNPSSVYRKGVDILVVYRDEYKTISIYANPDYILKFPLLDKWNNIEFAGHEKACGSPRGLELDFYAAIKVADEIARTF